MSEYRWHVPVMIVATLCAPLVACAVRPDANQGSGALDGEVVLGADSAASSCPRCMVVLEPDLILVDSAAGLIPGEWSSVARAPSGRLYLSSSDARAIISYDPDGKRRNVVERQGDGPGEFRRVGPMYVGPGDSLFVSVDESRLMVLGPDLEFGREVRTPHACQVPLTDGAVLCAGGTPTTEGRQPFHVLRADGSIIAAFGRHPSDSGCVMCAAYLAQVPGEERAFVAIAISDYRLMTGDASGGSGRAYRVDSPWLPGEVRVAPMSGRLEGSGRVWGLSAGPLPRQWWVFGSAPIGASMTATEFRRPPGTALGSSVAGYATILELLDLDRGVVATIQLPGRRLMPLTQNSAYEVRAHSSGYSEVTIWKIRLTEQ